MLSVSTHILPLPNFCADIAGEVPGEELSLVAPVFIESVAEVPVMQHIHGMLTHGGRFVDAGAHIGFYTVALSGCFETVVAFEPSRFQFEFLEINIRANRLFHCEARPQALGASVTFANLNVTGRTGGTNTLLDLGPELEPMDVYPVEVVPLDACGFPDVTFLKIDVEGWELDVLRGASETLLRCQPLLLVEVWDEPVARSSVAAFLAAHGYQFVFPFPEFPELGIGSPSQMGNSSHASIEPSLH